MTPPPRKQLTRFICLLGILAIGGCKDRTQDVVGVWDWGTYAVHFDADKSWSATDKLRPTYEKMAGEWSVSGDKVKLTYSGSDPISAQGSVFILTEDGLTLNADVGAMGTMKKRLAPAGLDVK
jgi:hypothetical protein